MNHEIINVERLFDAPVTKVWTAITSKEEMKLWYFDLAEFKVQVGFSFQFTGGQEDGIQYVHICEITEVIPQQKLTYSWRYEGYAGVSFVSFELFAQEDKTLLLLTHTGIGSFPENNPDLAINNFKAGWDAIINTSLKEYLSR